MLVTGEIPLDGQGNLDKGRKAVFIIHGWAWKQEVRANFRSAGMPKPCYFVAREALHTELPLKDHPTHPFDDAEELDLGGIL